MSTSRRSLWQTLLEPLSGTLRPAPPAADDWPELKAKLDAAMPPTMDRGKAWLKAEIAALQSDQNFYDVHRDRLLSTAPALSRGAMAAWMSLIEEPAWSQRLQPHQIVLLLNAMMIWRVAAAERALKRQGALVRDLNTFLGTRVLEETTASLQRQDVVDEVFADLRLQASEANQLYPLAVDALESEVTDAGSELTAATSRFSQTEELKGFAGGLDGAWKVMDIASIGVLYRVFGQQLDG